MLKRKNNSLRNGNYSFIKGLKQIKRPALQFIILSAIFLSAILFYVLKIGCPFMRFFDKPCPACGITRAWIAFFQLDFLQAFAYNYMFLSIPVLALYILFDGEPFYNKRLNYGVLIFIALCFLSRYIFGNIV